MKDTKIFVLFLVFLFIGIGCEKFTEQDKFKRPDWLPGKLYTAVSVQGNLSMFAECLRITGLDTILDVSGSWTVFAPDNEAMNLYLSENQYASISHIPKGELERITEFHVIQNPWSLEQLQSLGASGWRTGNSKSSDSYAYKRQTMFKNPVEKYWIKKMYKKEVIVLDSTISNNYKKVFVESRKYVPIFYDEYLNKNGLSSEDFNFYFNRPYEHGNVYFAGSKIIRADIFAENGFVHIIDKVVNPMLNAKEILEREYTPDESYRLYLEMVYWYYPTFVANLTATYNQPEVRFGGQVDTLWDLDYTNLAFAIHQERTGYEGSDLNQSVVRQNGLFVPTDDAFRNFIDGILTVKSGYPHWSDHKSLPRDIANIIITQNLKTSPIYPSTSQYNDIFRKKSRFQQNEGAIIRKEFGSNCTFIGLNSYIPDRVFTSVTRAVFCRPEYTTFRLAMLYSGTQDAIANHAGELYFFPINDYALAVDSSLILNWVNKDDYVYNFRVMNRDERRIESIGSGTIRSRILNQVGTSMPNGSANKEFIRTLGGNYITWDHTNNTIQGTLPCTFGYNGTVITTCSPALVDEPADNGRVWSVNYWFNFRTNNLQTVLSQYPKFYSLLNKAALIDEGSSELLFMDKNENYTIFVPSDKALSSFQVDTLDVGELRKFLKHHFVQGEMIFTDNKQPSGYYHTASGTSLNIRTGPDVIEIPDGTGRPYIVIPEKENITNQMVSEKTMVSAVVHEIDKVLIHY